MKTLHLGEPIDRSHLRRGSFLIAALLACFTLLPAPRAFAVTPAPDGGYPGGNTAEDTNALFNLSTGLSNTGLGVQALYHDTTGGSNTATGFQALLNNATGNQNTAYGAQSLYSNISGNSNTAIGVAALRSVNTGGGNTAVGAQALFSNTGGAGNTADGLQALYHTTIGSENTAIGWQALFTNRTGTSNTATGAQGLYNNTSGYNNTADGAVALYSNSGGYSNTAIGVGALFSNVGGVRNTAVGTAALDRNTSGSHNVAVGDSVAYYNTTGSYNIAIGDSAGNNLSTGSYNIDVGNEAVAGDGRTIRVGTQDTQTRTFIAGVYNANENGTIRPVYINGEGQLGTQPPASARRFKQQIRPMDRASEAVLALKPVTFEYKADAAGARQFGLIAEEVAEVNPDLVARDENGEIYTVRYDAVNAMLLNEFLKEHRKVEKQEATISELQSTVAHLKKDFQATVEELTKRLDGQASQIEKVSAQVAAATAPHSGLAVNRRAPQIVGSNQ